MTKIRKEPDSKQCKCGAFFYRDIDTSANKWKWMRNCEPCREKRASKQDRQDHHAGFIVNHPAIDVFLYGRPA